MGTFSFANKCLGKQHFVVDESNGMLSIRPMRLADYLAENGGPIELAKRLGVTAEAVRLWAADQRMPRRDVMARLVEATGGKVTANDFFEPVSRETPPEAA